MKLIALEEAFWYDQLATDGSPLGHLPVKSEVVADWQRRLADFTEFGLTEMDEHAVDTQVLSLTSPGIQTQPNPRTAVADGRAANDYLASVISDHPARFAGLAAVPLQDPEQAAAELRRAVDELGLCGALVNDHTVLRGYPELDTATRSWAARTGGHAMRLIFGGVFDRFPNARIILGHMGEFLPFQLYAATTSRAVKRLSRRPACSWAIVISSTSSCSDASSPFSSSAREANRRDASARDDGGPADGIVGVSDHEEINDDPAPWHAAGVSAHPSQRRRESPG